MLRRRARAFLASFGIVTLALTAPSLAPARADDTRPHAVPGRVLVRFAADGPNALLDCAESLHRRGAAFAEASAAASDSLDALHRELGVREIRAVFRRPNGTPLAQQRAALGYRAASQDAPGEDLAHIYQVTLDADAVPAAIAGYGSDPQVVWVQRDFFADPDGLPADPFLSSSGSWGQPYGDLWGLHAIDAPAAWARTLGEGVVVAVVDSGLDTEHPDIRDNLWLNPGEDLDGSGRVDDFERNGIDDDGNGFADDFHGFDFINSRDANSDGDYTDEGDESDGDPFDDSGHGSHVAGTIAARDNDIGIVGVAPRARIMALKGFPGAGGAPISVLAQGIVYAGREGAHVISNSWSCRFRCPSNPIAEEAVRFAHARGAVLVFSAGNKGDDVAYYSPEKLPETIVVGSSDERDALSDFSSRGLLMDVVAPGAGSNLGGVLAPNRGILSLRSSGANPALDGGGTFAVAEQWLRLSGTSMSTPHVAGVAALVRSLYPEADSAHVRRAIRSGADDLGAPGADAEFGAGRLNAQRALALIPAELSARLLAPAPTAIFDPRDGAIEIRGEVAGGALARWSLSRAAGLEGGEWTALESDRTDAVDGVLHALDPSTLPDGGYTLRLRVETRDGPYFDEFTLLSLERNRPRFFSRGNLPAGAPTLSADTVVWHQSLFDPEDDFPGDEQFRLFRSAWGEPGSVTALTSTLGQQRFPSLQGGVLAWAEGLEPREPGLAACRLARSARAPCRPRVLQGEGPRSTPIVARGRVWWAEDGIFHCRATGRCEPRRVDGTQGAIEMAIDGRRLLWTRLDAGSRALFTCSLEPGFSRCTPQRVETGRRFHFDPDFEGALIAWEDTDFQQSSLRFCVLDPDTGACPTPFFPHAFTDDIPPRARVAGQRILWQTRPAGEDEALFFCEFDPIREECPPQRLTGAASPQSNADLDGHRVVWEDRRNGSAVIAGFELPRLAPLRDRRDRAGRRLRVPLRASDPAAEPITWSVAAERDDGAEATGLSFVGRRLREGKAALVWRPQDDDAGAWTVNVTADFHGGLESRRSFRWKIRPAR